MTYQTHSFKVPHILIVEDDDGHADLVQEGLRDSGIFNPIIRFANGAEAWDFLTGKDALRTFNPEGAYLILLDIQMPQMDGIEVLRRIKSEGSLRSTPVIMLTTTDDPREIEHCYELGCNA